MAYAYMVLSLLFLTAAIALLWRRRDLRWHAFGVAMFGAFIGLLAELFYWQDYWRPPFLLGFKAVSLEAAIIGAALMLIGAFAYPVLAGKKPVEGLYPPQKSLTKVLILASAVVFGAAVFVTDVNSVIASSAIFVLVGAVACMLRRDLLRAGITTSLAMLAIMIPIYCLVFGAMAPLFWTFYWSLAGTPFDVRLFDIIPYTEILWYASWGFVAGVMYPFIKGNGFERHNKSDQ